MRVVSPLHPVEAISVRRTASSASSDEHRLPATVRVTPPRCCHGVVCAMATFGGWSAARPAGRSSTWSEDEALGQAAPPGSRCRAIPTSEPRCNGRRRAGRREGPDLVHAPHPCGADRRRGRLRGLAPVRGFPLCHASVCRPSLVHPRSVLCPPNSVQLLLVWRGDVLHHDPGPVSARSTTLGQSPPCRGDVAGLGVAVDRVLNSPVPVDGPGLPGAGSTRGMWCRSDAGCRLFDRQRVVREVGRHQRRPASPADRLECSTATMLGSSRSNARYASSASGDSAAESSWATVSAAWMVWIALVMQATHQLAGLVRGQVVGRLGPGQSRPWPGRVARTRVDQGRPRTGIPTTLQLTPRAKHLTM